MSDAMKAFFVIAALLFFIPCGYGLKCYLCYTTTGWSDCASVKEEQTCPSGFDRCGKAFVKGEDSGIKVEIYAKGCATKAACDESAAPSALCKNQLGEKAKCEVHCCTGDLCNGAAVPMISVFMLLSLALVPFLG